MKCINVTVEMALFACVIVTVSTQNCSSSEFECLDGSCIPNNYLCDNVYDCKNGEDETLDPEDCPPCEEGLEWRCDNGHCIWEDWVCDNFNDCMDASDEKQDCPPCPSGYHTCDMGGCVADEYLCDHMNQCLDWSDESEEACPCSDDEIRCNAPPIGGPAGACIPREHVCDPDGIWDCFDGMDESNCTTISV